MKSKYIDLKKFKLSLDPPEILKNSRKQTKPKKNHKPFIGHDNQTQSDYQHGNSDKEKKRQKLPTKKVTKQMIKSHQPSPKKHSKTKYEESSSSNEVNFNRQHEFRQRQKSFKTGRQVTEAKQEPNFIGQLNNYLNDLKKSKLDLSQNHTSKNQTLLMNKLSFREQQKLQSQRQNSSRLQKKIKRQKSINRNLQKCIIEIQKVLWDRTDQLQILQEQVRRSVRQRQSFFKKGSQIDKNSLSKTIFFNQQFRNKKDSALQHRNNKHIFNNQESNPINQYSKIGSKQRPFSIYYKTNSETDQQSSATFKQKPRRKTQAAINIQKMLQKTLDSKGLNRTKLLKPYNKFQKEDLNDV